MDRGITRADRRHVASDARGGESDGGAYMQVGIEITVDNEMHSYTHFGAMTEDQLMRLKEFIGKMFCEGLE
jgi:hypothetical protein